MVNMAKSTDNITNQDHLIPILQRPSQTSEVLEGSEHQRTPQMEGKKSEASKKVVDFRLPAEQSQDQTHRQTPHSFATPQNQNYLPWRAPSLPGLYPTRSTAFQSGLTNRTGGHMYTPYPNVEISNNRPRSLQAAA